MKIFTKTILGAALVSATLISACKKDSSANSTSSSTSSNCVVSSMKVNDTLAHEWVYNANNKPIKQIDYDHTGQQIVSTTSYTYNTSTVLAIGISGNNDTTSVMTYILGSNGYASMSTAKGSYDTTKYTYDANGYCTQAVTSYDITKYTYTNGNQTQTVNSSIPSGTINYTTTVVFGDASLIVPANGMGNFNVTGKANKNFPTSTTNNSGASYTSTVTYTWTMTDGFPSKMVLTNTGNGKSISQTETISKICQ